MFGNDEPGQECRRGLSRERVEDAVLEALDIDLDGVDPFRFLRRGDFRQGSDFDGDRAAVAQTSSSRCHSMLSRARHDTSRPSTIPAWPRPTSAIRWRNPSRSAVPDSPKSQSMPYPHRLRQSLASDSLNVRLG